jgi:hypothetical protein
MGDTQYGGLLALPQAIFTSALDWPRQLFSPLSVVRDSLNRSLQNDTRTLIGAYWSFPIILAVLTDAVVLHFYGIEFKDEPAFSVLYLTFTSLKLIFEAFILFAVLRLMRVKVTQGMVFVCYSIVAIYSPLFGWAEIPRAAHLYDVMTLLKAQHFGVMNTVSYFWRHAVAINNAMPSPDIVPYLAVVTRAISLLSLTLVAECLAQMLKLERPKAYTATAIASVFNLIPTILLGLSQMALIFAFMRDTFMGNPAQ